MSRFFWVRHGPTHAKGMVGWTDLPADLSDTAQIGWLDRELPREALVVSSDLVRASATADAIQSERQRLEHDAALREIHFGDWEMKHWKEIEDQERLQAYWDQPGEVSPPNGESWNAVSLRVSAAVDGLIAAYPGRDIVAVAHFGVILTRVQQAGRLTAEAALGHSVDPLSVTRTEFGAEGWRLGKIGACP